MCMKKVVRYYTNSKTFSIHNSCVNFIHPGHPQRYQKGFNNACLCGFFSKNEILINCNHSKFVPLIFAFENYSFCSLILSAWNAGSISISHLIPK